MTDKLFIYYRVSTKDQADKNTEENQERSIKKFLESRDVQIVEEFKDLGMSGASSDRPDYNKMLSRLDEVDGICVFDSDRLSRDLEMGIMLMFELRRYGKKLYESREGTIKDFSRNDDQLLHFISQWVAEQERKKLKARQLEGMQRYRESGKHWGPPVKEVNWRRYNELREAGVSRAAIARIMGMHPITLYRKLKKEGKE